MKRLETPNPLITPPLDPTFQPPVLVSRHVRELTQAEGAPLMFGLERANGEFSRFETRILPDSHPLFEHTACHILNAS
ncbi:MAG: hypothetical protein Fur0016_27310 [Anaerolineales bacterium]